MQILWSLINDAKTEMRTFYYFSILNIYFVANLLRSNRKKTFYRDNKIILKVSYRAITIRKNMKNI